MTVLATGSILVVDDDRVNRTRLARSLTASGHDVGAAENGRQSLESLRARPWDVVLLDVVMPELMLVGEVTLRGRAGQTRLWGFAT